MPIVSPPTFSPDTAQPLLALAEVLLRGPNTLTSAEHKVGDVALRELAKFLQAQLRAQDVASRYGGDDCVSRDETASSSPLPRFRT